MVPFGSACMEPFHATWTRQAPPRASCAPRIVPAATALPSWLFTRIGFENDFQRSLELTYEMSPWYASPV